MHATTLVQARTVPAFLGTCHLPCPCARAEWMRRRAVPAAPPSHQRRGPEHQHCLTTLCVAGLVTCQLRLHVWIEASLRVRETQQHRRCDKNQRVV